MYSPAHYITEDQDKIRKIIAENPLATLIIGTDAIHLPLIQKGNKLIGHLALRNPASKQMDGKEILVIFHGPEGYISADWYESQEKLPTWNYEVVHVRGQVRMDNSDEFVKEALLILGKHMEPEYNLEKAIEEERNQLKQIIGFEISIGSIEAKSKLAQQKSPEERKNVIRHLEKKKLSHPLAEAMKETL